MGSQDDQRYEIGLGQGRTHTEVFMLGEEATSQLMARASKDDR